MIGDKPRTWRFGGFSVSLEAQLPIYWVPVFESLYNSILYVTQGPTICVLGVFVFWGRFKGVIGINRAV